MALRNRLEKLEDDGYVHSKEVQRCSSCKCQGHKKRTLTELVPGQLYLEILDEDMLETESSHTL